MKLRQDRHLRVRAFLENDPITSGFNKTSIFECEWNALKRSDPWLRSFLDEHVPKPRVPMRMSETEIINGVKNGTFTGFLTVSLKVQDDKREHYDRFPTIFRKRTIKRKDLRPPMLDYVKQQGLLQNEKGQELLVADHSCKELTLYSPYLRYLLVQCDVHCVKLHEAVFWTLRPVAKKYFTESLEMRKRFQDAGNEAMGKGVKLVNNATYGASILNYSKLHDTVIVDADEAMKYTNNARWITTSTLVPDKSYLVSLAKRSVTIRRPIHIGLSILNLAKVRNFISMTN